MADLNNLSSEHEASCATQTSRGENTSSIMPQMTGLPSSLITGNNDCLTAQPPGTEGRVARKAHVGRAVVVPTAALEVKSILEDIGIRRYDGAAVQVLIDLLQRETLSLLNASAELAELRQSSSMSCSDVGKKPILIQEADAELAAMEYSDPSDIQPELDQWSTKDQEAMKPDAVVAGEEDEDPLLACEVSCLCPMLHFIHAV
eukprot:GHVQ01010250.1.p1 GENE.GHVQ01010250.1~~GHVQ01010250.1.p1  ORF type:complete len:203 (-),score=33.47 GHVQ01010250.1:95-703(-)